jgi:hypothetical protein
MAKRVTYLQGTKKAVLYQTENRPERTAQKNPPLSEREETGGTEGSQGISAK